MPEQPSLSTFHDRFPDEQACWTHLRTVRWGADGFTCPRCDEDDHWGRISTRQVFECYECGHQASVTAGTILQDTKLPLRTWFLAAYLVLTTKKGLSTLELARKTGVTPKTAWFLHHKIVRCLGPALAEDLFGVVEADETFLGGKGPAEGGRPANQAIVVGAVERRDGRLGRARLVHVPDRSRRSLAGTVTQRVQPGSQVRTDAWPGYRRMEGYDHDPESGRRTGRPGRHTPGVHAVFTNLKRVMEGVHTHCAHGRLQAFLDLFVYRFDRRDDLVAGFMEGVAHLAQTGPWMQEEVRAAGRLRHV